jgi:hypothetical protein
MVVASQDVILTSRPLTTRLAPIVRYWRVIGRHMVRERRERPIEGFVFGLSAEGFGRRWSEEEKGGRGGRSTPVGREAGR